MVASIPTPTVTPPATLARTVRFSLKDRCPQFQQRSSPSLSTRTSFIG
nr:MAG TPA: hypothetical protein [Caudoviricetes sp.]